MENAQMAGEIYKELSARLRTKYSNYAAAWDAAHSAFGGAWEQEFDHAIVTLFGSDPEKWLPAIDGYAHFATDALRSQIYFERNGRYQASSYADVAAKYYHNKDFMLRAYLPGMYLSHYVWAHHHRMLRWYRSLVEPLNIKTFAEVGTGCGIYSKETLRLKPLSSGKGFDISEHSLRFTQGVADAFGVGKRYATEVRDIVADTPAPSDLVICQEVLEHLEDPAEFCRALYRMTSPGAHAYITAAINAGHVDHIYLYRNLDEVLAQIEAAGFEVLERHNEIAPGAKKPGMEPSLGGALCRRPL
jgi:2-polyprenyl-3-methyl-5-hydroxy-6-metoxy-1,4-benzoquinol methylase